MRLSVFNNLPFWHTRVHVVVPPPLEHKEPEHVLQSMPDHPV
jgi:hypothetical protein